MFIKWVQENLIPTFKQIHPGKQMVLIMDNALYHHKRKIGTFSSKTKQELVEMCKKYKVEYIDLQSIDNRLYAYRTNNHDKDNVQFQGDLIELTFDEDIFIARPTINQPFIPAVQELRAGIVGYLKINNPKVLECQVKNISKVAGHFIIWAPP
jgi:hypothetical protein